MVTLKNIVPQPTTEEQTAKEMLILFGLVKNKEFEYVMTDKEAVKNAALFAVAYCRHCSIGAGSYYSTAYWDKVAEHIKNS